MSAAAPAMTSMVATGPAMTSMYASPATYTTAPAMTSMYATPGASMYMPSSTVAAPYAVAAPTVVETVAATTTKAPSIVQAPSVVAPVVVGPAFGMPQPQKLTQGMPEPALLEKEKAAYTKALEAQLKKQTDAVMEEANIKKKMLEADAQKRRAEFELQLNEKLKMDCLMVDQEANTQCNGLREAAITQQTNLEETAAKQTADYTKKKCLEDFSLKSYELQKQWFEKETAFNKQYQEVMQKGAGAIATSGPTVVQPAATVVQAVTGQYAASLSAPVAAPTVIETMAAPVTYAAAAPVTYAAASNVTYAAPVTMAY